MTKLMSIVSFVLIIAVLAIVVLKMSGQGELVNKTSNALVNKLGLSNVSQSKDSFAKEALGWDITEIRKKPLATVKAGKVRLQKVIDNLESLRLKYLVATTGAEHKNKESQEEMKGLLESIHAAQAHLKDPAGTYPAMIKGFAYANRAQLQSATAKAIRRYQSLEGAATLGKPTEEHGQAVTVDIEKRLDVAYAIMESLNARLTLAEMQENDAKFDEIKKELENSIVKVLTIIKVGEADVQQLPSGFTSRSDRDADTVNSFTK